jgi:HTH-type transcriptional regulator/antitoxin HigA
MRNCLIHNDKLYYCKDIFFRLIITKKEITEKTHFSIGKPVLCDVIKTRMNEMNLTQKSLAEMLGISAPRVNEYLCGKSLPTLQIARKIHKKLNIDANVILGAV